MVFPFLVHINIKMFLTHDKREKDFVFPPYDGGMAKKRCSRLKSYEIGAQEDSVFQ